MDSTLRHIFSAVSSQLEPSIFLFMGILVLLSSFFSAAETAFASVKIERLQVYAEEHKKGAQTALNVASHFEKTLSTILVGNNLVNIALATLSVKVFQQIIQNPNTADIVSTLTMTLIILMFGEILPKSFAKRYAEKLALRFGIVIYYLNIIFTPFTAFFMFVKHAVLKDRGMDEKPMNEAELNILLDNMEESGVIQEDEVELIQSVLDLNDKTVSDIMVPRIDMVAINVNEDIEKIKKMFFEHQYSRMPIYEGDKDNIIGILYERDFFTKLLKNQKINIKQLCKPAKYVSKSMKVDALIQELQKSKVHMAIVSGEYGDTVGVVTMEDALEELVGEIYDEHDDLEPEGLIEKMSDTEYLVDASIEIDDLFEELSLGKAPDTQYSRLSGWLYDLVEDVPKKGNEASYTSRYVELDEDEERYIEHTKLLRFKINAVAERRIKSVILTITELTSDEDTE